MTRVEEMLRIAANSDLALSQVMKQNDRFTAEVFKKASKLRLQFSAAEMARADRDNWYDMACLEAAQYLAEGGR